MKKQMLLALGCFIILSLTLAACSSNNFAGNWKPISPADTGVIDSLTINADKTFVLKFKDSSRKEISGTYTIEKNKIELTNPLMKPKAFGTINGEGQLMLTEEGRSGGSLFAKS